MCFPRLVPFCSWCLALATCGLLAQTTASAQEQERSLRDRIERPNMDLHATGFEKTFTPGASGLDKAASVKTFGFSRAATTKGDGSFSTHSFNSSPFKTGVFSTRKSGLTDRGAAQSDRTFDTKTMAVHEDRAAGKTAPSQMYQPSDKPFISHGRRQDEIDELRRQKDLSIDQVREILNKNK